MISDVEHGAYLAFHLSLCASFNGHVLEVGIVYINSRNFEIEDK